MTEFIVKKFVKNHADIKDSAVRAAYGKLAGFVGIICNIILFAAKITVGTIAASVSITADAVNNLSDASSSIISLVGFKLAERPADEDHPYGHGRYEYLSALTVAVIILVIGVELFKSGVEKILSPEKADLSVATVVVLILSILMKLWMMLFNRKLGKRINSGSLIATAADCRNDVVTTGAVLLASVISHYSGFELDGMVGVAVAVFILISGLGLIKETINPMLGTAPDEEFVEKVREKILSYEGVIGMHDLIIHDYGPCRRFASVHVEMAAEEDVLLSHDVIDNIELDFKNNEGLHLVIHFDPILTKNPLTNDIRAQVERAVKEIDERLSIHDLRVVPGNTHTNIVFDCVRPHSVDIKSKELVRLIDEKVKTIDEKYNCVITIDDSFAPMPK